MCRTPLHGHRLRTPATNTTNEHHQRRSSQQVVDVQHVRSRLNLLYNILPATRTPPTDELTTILQLVVQQIHLRTDKNLPHPNILACRDVRLWHCDVKKVRTSICIAHTVYCTPLMRSRHWTEPPGWSAHSLHTQAERRGPTTGHGSQQQSGLHLP